MHKKPLKHLHETGFAEYDKLDAVYEALKPGGCGPGLACHRLPCLLKWSP